MSIKCPFKSPIGKALPVCKKARSTRRLFEVKQTRPITKTDSVPTDDHAIVQRNLAENVIETVDNQYVENIDFEI